MHILYRCSRSPCAGTYKLSCCAAADINGGTTAGGRAGAVFPVSREGVVGRGGAEEEAGGAGSEGGGTETEGGGIAAQLHGI